MTYTTVTSRALLIGVLLVGQSVFSISYADDALVLPKGTWRFLVDSTFFLPITKRFDKDGKKEDVAADFNTVVDNTLLSGAGISGVPPGFNIGRTVTSFKWDIQQVVVQPAYGITDRFTVGLNIPYWWLKNNVTFNLNTTGANLGKNPALACGSPLCPFFVPGTVPVTTQDVQNVLGPGLQIGPAFIPGLGIKPIKTWEHQGIGDIEAGGRYQLYNSEKWRTAFTGGARFPTGAIDDPDNLVDRGTGTGAYALLFRLHQDFVRQKPGPTAQLGIPEPGSFTINGTIRYDLILPDQKNLRVCDIHQPICPTKATVDRDLGDIVEAEISANVGLPVKGLFFSPLYKYGHGFKDHHTGSPGPDYGALADESDYNEHIYKVSLGYSTIPLFLENKFPLPLIANVTFRNRFAGDNNLYRSQFIGFTIAAFF